MHRLLVIFVIFIPILFDTSWVRAGNRFHERNRTGLLVLYGFDDGQRSETLHSTTARDYTGRGLLGDLTLSTTSIAWNASRAGFSIPSSSGGPRANSQLTSANLLAQLLNEFSIEFFFSSPSNPGSSILISGFGDWSPGSPFPSCDSEPSTVEGGWRMFSSAGSGIRFQVVMSAEGTPSCFEVSFVTGSNVLRHCALRARNGELSVNFHGALDSVLNPGLSFNPAHWLRHPSHLTFAVPQPTEAWKGSMYMFAMHDRYLSDAEISSNRAYGPPNSLPVASAADVPIATTEDVTKSLYP